MSLVTGTISVDGYALGAGTRFFAGIAPLDLEVVDSRAAASVTHVTYRVLP